MWYYQLFINKLLKYKPYDSNFVLSSKSILAKNPNLKKKFFLGGGGGGKVGFRPEKNNNKHNTIRFFVLMLFIKFQAPGSNGALVVTQTKE